MKRQLMRIANALRGQGQSRKQAIGRAWATIDLMAKMDTCPTVFHYIKRDGTHREATGYYDAAPQWVDPQTKNPLVIRYYDLDKQNWRRFRADRLIIPNLCQS